MKHKIAIGIKDLSTKWGFVRTEAHLDIDDKGSNALGWWIVESQFTYPHANQGHATVEHPLSANAPNLILMAGSKTAGVLVGFSIKTAREGDNSKVFGVRATGEFKLAGSEKPYVWQWISTEKK